MARLPDLAPHGILDRFEAQAAGVRRRQIAERLAVHLEHELAAEGPAQEGAEEEPVQRHVDAAVELLEPRQQRLDGGRAGRVLGLGVAGLDLVLPTGVAQADEVPQGPADIRAEVRQHADQLVW